MKIYTIKIEQGPFTWDSYKGHVVVANTEEEVRDLAKKISADEGKEVWDSAKVEHCGDSVWQETEPFILLSDFVRG